MPQVLGLAPLTTWPGSGNADLFRFAALLAFLQRGQGQRARPALAKKHRALPNEITERFPSVIKSVFP